MATLDFITKEDLQQFKTELFEELKLFSAKGSVEKIFLRSSEVRELLKISPGTLQNLRIKGILAYKKIGGILYYAQADINRLLGETGNS